MSTLYLDRKGIEIRADGPTLVFHLDGERYGSTPVALLQRVVIRGAARLDSAALGVLAEAGVGVVLLNPRNHARTAILPGRAHNDAARRIGQYRAYIDSSQRAAFARTLVVGKLRAQTRLLTRALGDRPDRRKDLMDGVHTLDEILSKLAVSDDEDPTLATLRGFEGAGAAAYFRAFTSLFAPELEFTGRNRRPPRDPVNACLSLGYTLVHSEAVLACHGAGLDPLLGFYHELVFGRDSLAADLVEPLRPRVDAWVWSLFRSRELRPEHFSVDKGACLLGKAGRSNFYSRWEAHARGLRRWLRLQTMALAKDLAAAAPLAAPTEEDTW